MYIAYGGTFKLYHPCYLKVIIVEETLNKQHLDTGYTKKEKKNPHSLISEACTASIEVPSTSSLV